MVQFISHMFISRTVSTLMVHSHGSPTLMVHPNSWFIQTHGSSMWFTHTQFIHTHGSSKLMVHLCGSSKLIVHPLACTYTHTEFRNSGHCPVLPSSFHCWSLHSSPSPTHSSSASLLGADVQNVVSSDEGIPILVFQLTIDVFFCLLQCNVHVAVQTS